MKKTDGSNVDFAALRTLRLVHDLGSFSLAARRLDVNQSTVSYTIDRLRRIFGDPLFVPTRGGIRATERCETIVKGAARLLERYEELSRPRHFDPAGAEFDVTFAITHQQRHLVGTPVIAFLRRAAPGVRVRLINAHGNSHADLLEGRCDILITPIPYSIGAFYRRHLLTERYVCVVDRDHPSAGGTFSFEEFSAAAHILVSYEDFCQLPYVATLDALGLPFSARLDLPSTADIESFIVGTDLVATVIEPLAREYSDAVALVEPPFDHRMDIHMYWTARTHRLENMRWIRDVVIKAAKEPEALA
jgi:DNA-binding transcriptional LysR family regulator